MQDSIIHYFAYGSNLHPLRLKERVPSARLLGPVKFFGQKLHFHKNGADGSGKCNLVETTDRAAIVYGALYQLKPEDKTALDRIEGKGKGYTDKQIRLQHNNCEYSCFTYLAQSSHITDNLLPYHWYKKLVTLGAKHLEFPNVYIRSIANFESVQDPDSTRRQLNENLINRMTSYKN